MGKLTDRIAHAWNVFKGEEKQVVKSWDYGPNHGRPDRLRGRMSNDKSILTSIMVRIAMDASSVQMRHIRTDKNGQYLEDVQSGLNYCLTQEANLDQAASFFRQSLFMALLEIGEITICPIDTTLDPNVLGGFDVKTMRVGSVVQRYPKHVTTSVYNEEKGDRQDVTVEKKWVGIVQNPLYAIMNEPNSTLQRIMRKLNLLDTIDEASASGKLDVIIQLPYVVKGDVRVQQANERVAAITDQLKNSSHGIAYADATEKITQLNRPVENRLLEQVEYLLVMLYGQLGVTAEVMNGTAEEAVMVNYHNRTVEPLVRVVTEEMSRKFLSRTARTQLQTVGYFHDPFKYMPMADFAEIVDKLTRNEVASSNEIRGVIGWRPSADPKANELWNSNMPRPEEAPAEDNSDLDALDSAIDEAFAGLGVDENAGG